MIAALGLATLTACGDSLVEGDYRGIPLYTFEGQVATVSTGGEFDAPVRAAIFWSPAGATDLNEDLVEQGALSVAVRFPGTFTINVFEGPPEVAWGRPEAPVRVGLILVYEDVDGDGRATLDEVRGGSANQVLLFAERAVAAADSPTGRPLDPGYHGVRVPLPCEADDHDLAAGSACGVALGAACAVDADCGGAGICLLGDGFTTYPGGYCVLPEGDCTPRGANRLRARLEGVAATVWAPACREDESCRVAEGYTCDGEICTPGAPASLVLDPAMRVAPLCADEGPDHD